MERDLNTGKALTINPMTPLKNMDIVPFSFGMMRNSFQHGSIGIDIDEEFNLTPEMFDTLISN